MTPSVEAHALESALSEAGDSSSAAKLFNAASCSDWTPPVMNDFSHAIGPEGRHEEVIDISVSAPLGRKSTSVRAL